jgi:hypothetical protein
MRNCHAIFTSERVTGKYLSTLAGNSKKTPQSCTGGDHPLQKGYKHLYLIRIAEKNF